MSEQQLPEGYMKDAKGRLVPVDMVSEYDKERDTMVRALVEKAKALQVDIAKFKAASMGDVEAFVELSNERYDAKVGGNKGNVTLTTFDGSQQVKVQVQDKVVFDERIQGAKAIIDECINAWMQDSRSEVKVLVDHAFQVDKEGKMSVERILSLTRLHIDDGRWQQAMQAIKDSITTTGTSSYLRLYERDGAGKMQAISLDIANL